MKAEHLVALQKLGLAPTEAQVYLSLAGVDGSLSASGIVAATGVARGTIYPTLNSLVERGIVQNGEGYGSQFSALSPEEALPALIAAEKEKLVEAESLAAHLIRDIQSTAEKKQNASESRLIEVLRDPRAYKQRCDQLLRAAQQEVDVFVKAPFFVKPSDGQNNPEETKGLRRGVVHRAIYEAAILEDDHVAPYLKQWIKAGEEARVYQDELPLKLVLFDSKIAWMPLETQTPRHPIVSVLIRHPALTRALGLLFDYLWQESVPIRFDRKTTHTKSARKTGKRSKK